MDKLVQKYLDHRDDIKSGDIVLYRGNGIISNLIHYIDDAYYTHVGVIWKVEDPDSKEYRLLTMDMWTNGLVLVPLSERLSNYEDFCIIRPEVSSDMIEVAIFNSLKLWEGKTRYDYLLLLRISIIKKLRIDLVGYGKLTKYICSEFVDKYCKMLGIHTFDNINLITPEDFRRYFDKSKFIKLFDTAPTKIFTNRTIISLDKSYCLLNKIAK